MQKLAKLIVPSVWFAWLVFLYFYMPDRVIQFMPSVIVLSLVTALMFLYTSWFQRSGHMEREWIRNNKSKALFEFLPNVCITTPVSERLFFSSLPIIVFTTMSPYAWVAILMSGVLCAVARYYKFNGLLLDFTASVEVLTKLKRLVSIVIAISTGLVCGYIGIQYQSIYASVAAHFMFNMLPILALLVIALLVGVFVGSLCVVGFVLDLWDHYISWPLEKRRRRKRNRLL